MPPGGTARAGTSTGMKMRHFPSACATFLVLATTLRGLPHVPALPDGGQEKPIKPEVELVLDDDDIGFKAPSAVAVDEKREEIYVADQEADSITIFDFTGRKKARLPIPEPVSIALDSKGRIVVANARGKLVVYDVLGRKDAEITLSGLPEGARPATARQVTVDGSDNLYVLDSTNQILIEATPEGKLIRSHGAVGKKRDHKFRQLTGFWLGPKRLYLLDGQSSKVVVYSRKTGEFLVSFGKRGGGPGQISSGVSVVADRERRVYVLDTVRHSIVIFDEEGKVLRECGGMGKSKGWFYYPKSLNLDGRGRFYVCENTLRRVQVFRIPLEGKDRDPDDKRK